MLLARGFAILSFAWACTCTEHNIATYASAYRNYGGDFLPAIREKRGLDVGFLLRNLLLNSAQVSAIKTNAKFSTTTTTTPPPTTTTTPQPTTTMPPLPQRYPEKFKLYGNKFGPWLGYDYVDYDVPMMTAMPPPPPTTTSAPITAPPQIPSHFKVFGGKFGPWAGSDYPAPIATPRPAPPRSKPRPTTATTQAPPPPPPPPQTRPHVYATASPHHRFVNIHYNQPFGDYDYFQGSNRKFGIGEIQAPNYYSDYDYHQSYIMPAQPSPKQPPPRRTPPTTTPAPVPSPPVPVPRRFPFQLHHKLAYQYSQPHDTSSDDAAASTGDTDEGADTSNSNSNTDTNPGDGNSDAAAPDAASNGSDVGADNDATQRVTGEGYLSHITQGSHQFRNQFSGFHTPFNGAYLQPSQYSGPNFYH